MNNWLNQHRQAIKLVLSRMRSNKLPTFMICLVIAVAMCVPGLFYLGVDHLSKFTNHIQNETEISLFLKLDADKDAVSDIDAVLAKNNAIKQFHLVTKAQAWKELKSKTEINNATDSKISELDKNPLPDAFFIQAKSAEPEALESLKNELEKIPGVEHALLNTDWAKRLSALLSLGKKIILFITVLLALALLVVIGNTIRMQILTQKDEVVVSKLIGATNSFIRMPFLYAGIIYGLLGGLLATIMLVLVVKLFNLSVSDLSNLYSSDFSLPLINGQLFLGIISFAIFIGWLGSYLAVSRSIASIKID
ncbi:permease-like cell division protein FtsX [Methylotenera sp.]|uniref:permease-like cell division protein FtsX n=1 Tax=Methylotenera sp. TaxID=2051956 RepID=UPI002724271B|nr:permease-like cell division protein FtsX [Methylotenera sp.]MDO9206134.1 permease-like cell division protein FtsX [Methylotenera sp.]MDP1522974.1 permease-like cell division protein FtsX [Methylotenera sp.]MDP2070926.1 permease-like cell division protein FtsX [Methylotenera sp.]MDP3005800.1 permease-like cell division protein FtsX [Methylotenera sp.]MDP3307478.1 permease-like cell division protein FtsX [Methylotenera sp.]